MTSLLRSTKKGFTLIELLVVISIIAILSSIVLAALSSARTKGQYASVQESLIEMRNVYELQYTNVASYTTLIPEQMAAIGMGNKSASGYSCYSSISGPGYNNYCAVTSAAACSVLYTGSAQATQAAAICSSILATISTSGGTFYFGNINTTTAIDNTDYAFAVTNPSNTASIFCLRSSGGNTVIPASSPATCINKANW